LVQKASGLLLGSRWSTAVAETVIGIIPLRAKSAEASVSVSIEDLPGIVGVSAGKSYLDVAEALLHEADHQQMYSRQYDKRLFSVDTDFATPRFRSPWRPDPRPLSGILMGVSAFLTVAEFWTDMASRATSNKRLRYSAIKRAQMSLIQVQDGWNTLILHASFNRQGKKFASRLRERIRVAAIDSSKLDRASIWTRRARQRLDADTREWRERYAVTGDAVERVLARGST
jgi:HEXXH motif-containing protein